MIELTQEQSRTLAELADRPPRMVDPLTQRVYFLVSEEIYARAQAVLKEEQDVLGMYPLLAQPPSAPAESPELVHQSFDVSFLSGKAPFPPELREWALKQHTDEEIIAGLKEVKEKGGRLLSEVIAELERVSHATKVNE